MKLIERILKRRSTDFDVIASYAVAPTTLFVAATAQEYEKDTAASCLLAVTLDKKIAVDVVYESAGGLRDYVHVDGWHGLLFPDAVVEIAGGKTSVFPLKPEKNQRLDVIGRAGSMTLVGGKHEQKETYGFLARLEKEKLVTFATTTGWNVKSIAFAAPDKIFAGAGTLYAGNTRSLSQIANTPSRPHEILSLHATASGAVMIGCRDDAELFDKGTSVKLSGLPVNGGYTFGTVELHGVEHWGFLDADHVGVWRRTGNKLSRKYKAKVEYIGHREHEVPQARMTVTGDNLVVTNGSRIHMFDGKTWSQLKLQRDIEQPIKRMPIGMTK